MPDSSKQEHVYRRLVSYVSENDEPHTSPNRPFYSLLVTLVLHFINYAICIPVLSFYVFDVISHRHGYNISATSPCANITNGSQHTLELEVQKELSNFLTPLPFIWFFPGVLTTLFLGPLTDRFGRKIGLLAPMVGTLAKEVIYLIVIWQNMPLWILFIGNGVEGLSGGFAAVLISAFGIVSDTTLPGKERTFRISVVEATQAIASSVSMFAVGYAIKGIGYLYCILIALIINVVNICNAVFLVPETLEERRPSSILVTVRNIKDCFTFYVKDTEGKRKLKMILGLVAFILTISVNMSKPGIMTILLAKPPLCWAELKINIVSALQIIGNWVAILVFLVVVQKVFKLQDIVIGIFGCVSSMVACLIMAFSYTDAMVYAVVGTSILMRTIVPMLRSMMSRSANSNEQGVLYAGMGCIEMLCAAVIGSLSLFLYNQTVKTFPGAVFVVMAGLMLIVLGIFIGLNVLAKSDHVILTGYRRLDGKDFPEKDRDYYNPVTMNPGRTSPDHESSNIQ